jgi:hypothetical protein
MTDYETKLLPAILRAIAEERSDAVAINALNHAAEALEALALKPDLPVAEIKPDEIYYLGDSVYADFDGYYITLATRNGYQKTNTIFLDPSVQVNLVKFIERIVEVAA